MSAKVMVVQMPAGVQNDRLTNDRLADANADGWRANGMVKHNGLLVFTLSPHDGDEQKVVTLPPVEQFERPINERLAVEYADGWSVVAVESHNGFLVFLMAREADPMNADACADTVEARTVKGGERLPIGLLLVCSEPPDHDGDHRDFATNMHWPRGRFVGVDGTVYGSAEERRFAEQRRIEDYERMKASEPASPREQTQ